jgi:dipeptidyl aminopeptidase/acylaminoacyl peptidase
MYPRSFENSLTKNNQALAELGFIVVCVDAMGTAGRSKAFHNVNYKNMGKNLLDHVLAIKELAKKYA